MRIARWAIRLLRIISVWLALGLVAASAAEGYLRHRGFRFDPYRYYKRFGANFEGDEIHFYEQDSRLFWKFRPSEVIHDWWIDGATINSKGFRGPGFDWAKRPGDFRVLCLGDSGTFGWSIADDETYPARLPALLTRRRPGRRYEVINMGVPGYSSHQGLILLKRDAARMQPDVIVFSYGRNDHNDTVYLTDRQRRTHPAWLIGLQNALLRSRAYQWLFMKAALSIYKTSPQGFAMLSPRQTVRVPLPDFEDNLEQAARIAEAVGARMVFLPRAQWPQYNAAMQRIARERGDVYVDLSLQRGDKELLDFMHGEHPGSHAYERLANILADAVFAVHE